MQSYFNKFDKSHFHPVIAYQLNLKAVDFIASELIKPFTGKKIVITHHAPTFEVLRYKHSCETINAEMYNNVPFYPANFNYRGAPDGKPDAFITSNYGSNLEHLFKNKGKLVGADIWFHGHNHYDFEYALHGTRFVISALGHNYLPPENIDRLTNTDDGLIHALDKMLKHTDNPNEYR